MALSERTRRRGGERAQALIPHSRVLVYVVGRSGPNPSMVALAFVGGVVALAAVSAVVVGGVVFPGFLVIILLQHVITPPRGVALCDHGVAILSRSVWNGRPNAVLAMYPHGSLGRPVPHRFWYQSFLPDGNHVWLPGGEYRILQSVLGP